MEEGRRWVVDIDLEKFFYRVACRFVIGERVLESVSRYLEEKLKLKVNGQKSAVDRPWKSATNGRGPWWNAGASHMNAAFPKRYFDRFGLYSFMDHLQKHGSDSEFLRNYSESIPRFDN